jgi:hypothetical protein
MAPRASFGVSFTLSSKNQNPSSLTLSRLTNCSPRDCANDNRGRRHNDSHHQSLLTKRDATLESPRNFQWMRSSFVLISSSSSSQSYTRSRQGTLQKLLTSKPSCRSFQEAHGGFQRGSYWHIWHFKMRSVQSMILLCSSPLIVDGYNSENQHPACD